MTTEGNDAVAIDETAERWFTVPNRADRRKQKRAWRAYSRNLTRWQDKRLRPSGQEEG